MHSQNLSAVARAEQNIEETRLQMANLQDQFRQRGRAGARRRASRATRSRRAIRAAQDVLRRTVIRAPMAGTVVGLQVDTVGGVVSPGQALLDVVPKGDQLVVEAFVDPNDIDVVEIGLPAQVRLTALTQRNLGAARRARDDRVRGSTHRPAHGRRLFPGARGARRRQVGALDDDRLYPGMQAEVMIVTGARTTLDYLSQPIVESFNRAFREN